MAKAAPMAAPRISSSRAAARSSGLGWDPLTTARVKGAAMVLAGLVLAPALATYDPADPSFNASSAEAPANMLGRFGANLADVLMQSLGLGAWVLAAALVLAGLARISGRTERPPGPWAGLIGLLALCGAMAAPAPPAVWPLAKGLGGFWGETVLNGLGGVVGFIGLPQPRWIAAGAMALAAACAAVVVFGLRWRDLVEAWSWLNRALGPRPAGAPAAAAPARKPRVKVERELRLPDDDMDDDDPPFDLEDEEPQARAPGPPPQVMSATRTPKASKREDRENQGAFAFVPSPGFRLPELNMLAKSKPRAATADEAALLQNARLLESVLAEFGVSGRIDQIRPGPVVTLYELAPAPGVKTARVVALSDDIARSMSVVSCRVSVASGRNAIGIELPNARREMVSLRDMLSSADYERSTHVLPLALGETIGGEPYIADLARMPHLLIAGTTGSGKSVGVNAMILSILYRLNPEQCRLIMIDPKMLELSVYDGIPHLLAPVVTDPKKAIVALKWTVREMEDRYRRMSKIGVRNIAGYNDRARELAAKGEHFVRTVQTGFDETGRPVYEEERLDPQPMPYLVVVIDEVADLMMVAGKDIEGAVQRLAQMARAAGIHLIMATQRPSVDVITGTIKANFPTRISFQVTSKIDARTILGEQGAEQLLGQGDMLYMAGGGRITRLHGPFVSDGEVEAVAAFLRKQGEPQYLEEVTACPEEDEGMDGDFGGGGGEGADLYDQAVAVVTRDRKASTSYIQRRLQIGYNRAASLIERMEQEGVVSQANHAGKRDVLAGPPP
jgi:S-DNA-T family DNA segregation ATPase FtsK/SpoIIIE